MQEQTHIHQQLKSELAAMEVAAAGFRGNFHYFVSLLQKGCDPCLKQSSTWPTLHVDPENKLSLKAGYSGNMYYFFNSWHSREFSENGAPWL